MKASAFFFFALPAAAQFSGLATDYTGDRVWFSTALRQRSNPQQHFFAKIYSIDAAGKIELVAQRAATDVHREAVETEVSADGRKLAFHAPFYCSGHPGTRCFSSADEGRGIVQSGMVQSGPLPSGVSEFRGRVGISRNGRYAIRHSYQGYEVAAFDSEEWIDLQDNVRRKIPLAQPQTIRGHYRITSNGSALVFGNGALWLAYRDGHLQRIPAPELPWDDLQPIVATMDDNAGTIAYQTSGDTPELKLTRPNNSGPHLTLSCPGGCRQPELTVDGQLLSFVAEKQVWISSTARDDRRKITNDAAGIAEAVLSGDGRVIWAATFAGRILRITVADREVREMIGQTPVLRHPEPFLGFPLPAATGGFASLDGVGLSVQSEVAAAPLPKELGGVTITSTQGETFPLLATGPTQLRFLVPWSVSGRRTLIVGLKTSSPFESAPLPPLLFEFRPSLPEVYLLETGEPAVVHGDFRGLVTNRDAAFAGGIVHVFMTGLGPVSPPALTGEAAPNQPLSHVTLPMRFSWAGTTPLPVAPPELLFAGLAPGTVGLYQVSLRMPSRVPRFYSSFELKLAISMASQQVFVPLPLLP